MLVHRRFTPSIKFAGTHHTPGWREALWELSILPKNTTQCPRPGFKPRLLDPESSVLHCNHGATPPSQKNQAKLLDLQTGLSHKSTTFSHLINHSSDVVKFSKTSATEKFEHFMTLCFMAYENEDHWNIMQFIFFQLSPRGRQVFQEISYRKCQFTFHDALVFVYWKSCDNKNCKLLWVALHFHAMLSSTLAVDQWTLENSVSYRLLFYFFKQHFEIFWPRRKLAQNWRKTENNGLLK